MKKVYIIILLVVIFAGMFIAAIVISGKVSNKKSLENIISLQVNKTQITLQHNGLSEFIEITGTLSNGETENLTWKAIPGVIDQDVAIIIGDRIMARGKGQADIYMTYGNLETVISVEVLSDIDLETLMEDNKSETSNANGLTAAERKDIISKASAMYNVSWTPTQTLVSFGNMFIYNTDQTYNIPYSQTVNQIDDIEFETMVNSSDFYDSYKRYLKPYKRRLVMPKYGSDCSGFVSLSWGVQRESTSTFISKIQKGEYPKVGSYDSKNPTYSELLNAYSNMLPGDAVVRYGHVILIGENHPDFAYCYEQIGLEIELTYWTHSNLANRGYMPFSRE